MPIGALALLAYGAEQNQHIAMLALAILVGIPRNRTTKASANTRRSLWSLLGTRHGDSIVKHKQLALKVAFGILLQISMNSTCRAITRLSKVIV
jgi:hypothetical protein